MEVKILRIEDGVTVDAEIKDGIKLKLPSLQDGWRFNFPKHSKAKDTQTYILVTKETPDIVEGCLIYTMREGIEPYMGYIETAPHNKGKNKKHELVAGCLIAHACWLSFRLGKGDYLGWLAFDVFEENKDDRLKLMKIYSQKYKARRFGESTMIIAPEDGENLITEFLGIDI